MPRKQPRTDSRFRPESSVSPHLVLGSMGIAPTPLATRHESPCSRASGRRGPSLGGIRWGSLAGHTTPRSRATSFSESCRRWWLDRHLVPAPTQLVLLAVAFAGKAPEDSLTLTSGAAPDWSGAIRIPDDGAGEFAARGGVCGAS